MSSVLNRTTKKYLPSANTPDYDELDWIIDPDLSSVTSVPNKYWKIVGDVVSEMSTQEKSDTDAYIASNQPAVTIPTINVSNLPAKTAGTSAMMVSTFKPELLSTSIVSHDFCDKTTWYKKSVRVTDEVLTLDTGTTYTSTHTFWIDLSHSKLYDEDNIIGTTYNVVVKIDDVVQTTGYTVNYTTGKVTFDSAPGGEVKATYNYSNGSTYIVAPAVGKKLIIEHVELQFAENIVLNGFFDFEIWVYNPADLPNKVMYQRSRYKTIKDIINASNLGQGSIPAIDILTHNTLVFPFNYASMKTLDSAVGAEVRVKVHNDLSCDGEWGTCTFYCFVV